MGRDVLTLMSCCEYGFKVIFYEQCPLYITHVIFTYSVGVTAPYI